MEVQNLEQDIARCAQSLASRLPARENSSCSVQQLLENATVLAGLEASVEALVQLTVLARDVDVSLAEANACSSANERLIHFAAAVSTIQAACAAAAVLVRSDDGITPKRIQVAGSTRLNAVVSSVRQALSSELDGLLQSSGWPPPMSSSMSETSPTPAAWRPSSDVLPRVAALLDAVRIASSGAAPGRVDVPPSAWSLLRMAAPLCERLRFHFTSGGPADRRDRPEWLFLHTLRMGVAYAPAAAACLPDPPPGTRQMAHTAALTLALAEEAAVVLRSHFLPAMNADAIGGREATRGAWLHLADEARDFDLKLALVVGDTAARIGGASRVLVEKAEWDRHWTRAELDAALRQLDSAVDASDAWHDADPQDETAQAASSLAVLTPAHGMRPVCAVQALSVIQAACTRAAVLPHASQQRAFLREVPAAVAADFLGRVQRRAKGAAAFGDPVAPDSIVRTVSCICAAHVLQTGLEVVAEEPNVWELERQHASRALATMEMQHEHKNGARSGVFSPEVTQAAELKGEWRQALTQALVSQFMADAAALLPSLAAHASGEACAALAPAVLSLGSRIRHIRNSLDDALFADAWRDVVRGLGARLVEATDKDAGTSIARECARAIEAAWRS